MRIIKQHLAQYPATYLRVYRLKQKLVRIGWDILHVPFRLPEVKLESLVDAPVYDGPFITEDSYMPAPWYMNGRHGHNDLAPLLTLALRWQAQAVLELGTGYGNTGANLCQVLPDAHIYTVNALPEQISGSIISQPMAREEIGRVYRQHGYADRVTQIYADTMALNLAEYVAAGSLDLCIIDACHDTEYVLHDFLNVEPYMRPGGLVLLHDTSRKATIYLPIHSYRACQALRRRGYDVRQLSGTWWGLYIKPA